MRLFGFFSMSIQLICSMIFWLFLLKKYEATDRSDGDYNLCFHLNNTKNFVIKVECQYVWRFLSSLMIIVSSTAVFTFSCLHLFRCCNEDKCSTFHFVQRTDESFSTCFSNVVNSSSKDGLGAVVMGLLMIKCPEGIARGLVMSIYGAVIG